MIHPDTELKLVSKEKGLGLFASEFIPSGTIVYVQDQLEIVLSQVDYEKLPMEMQSTVEKYSYINHLGDRILSWDNGKFFNHCCHPNCLSTGYGFTLAINDIHPGDEMTDEYSLFNLEKEMVLDCPQKNCRGIVRPTDLEKIYPLLDSRIQATLPRIIEVEQKLWGLIDEETKVHLDDWFKDPGSYISVKELRYSTI